MSSSVRDTEYKSQEKEQLNAHQTDTDRKKIKSPKPRTQHSALPPTQPNTAPEPTNPINPSTKQQA